MDAHSVLVRLGGAAEGAPSGEAIVEECVSLAEMLCAKNAQYGDSALSPVRVFSRSSNEEQLLVRIDDKLSRVARGQLRDSEDVILDLIGYLILLRISRRSHADAEGASGSSL